MKSPNLVLVAALFLLACGGDDDPAGFLPAGDATIAAVGSNYTDTSVMSFVVLPQLHVEVAGVAGVASLDPVIRERGNFVVVINRFGFDNVTLLDAADFSLYGQVSTGVGSNPQDVAVLGRRLFVADAGGAGLTSIDLDDIGAGAAVIDLSSLDPDDGVPNCHAVEAVGERLFVSCGILDDEDDFLSPRQVGVVAVVDPDSGAIETTLELDHTSPVGSFVASPAQQRLYVATVPSFFDPASDGCIEVIDTGTADHLGCLVDNEALGGYASAMTWTEDGVLAAVVTGFDPDDFGPLGQASLIDPDAADPQPTTFTSVERVVDVSVCPTGERMLSVFGRGLQVFGASGDELTDSPIDIGAPVVSGGTICL